MEKKEDGKSQNFYGLFNDDSSVEILPNIK